MIKRELLIYFGILIIVAPIMHGGKLIDNFLTALDNPSKFGHSLIYTGFIYLIILIIRFIVAEIIRISKKAISKN